MAGDFGMTGVAIDSTYDMRTLFSRVEKSLLWVRQRRVSLRKGHRAQGSDKAAGLFAKRISR